MRDLIVFTDLDGTLLDHDSYSYAAAADALAALKEHGVPLVLASSKTAAEISVLHEALGLGDTPAIVENGSGLLVPGLGAEAGRYDALRGALSQVSPDLRAQFRGFGDMSAEQIAKITGLPLDSARLARSRQHSEPGLWTGSDDARVAFVDELGALGVHARMGGRFLTLSFGATKADQMAEIAKKLGKSVKIALGDAPNDREMLEAADYGVIIRNEHGAGLPPLPKEAEGRIRRTRLAGPEGWNRAVLDLLEELEFGDKNE